MPSGNLCNVWIKSGADDGSDEGLVSRVSVGRVGFDVFGVDELHFVQMLGELSLHVL